MRNRIILSVLLGVVGPMMLYLGLKRWGESALCSPVPEEIPLSVLISRGPGGNPNVLLTDFVLCDNYAFLTNGSTWSQAWVPAIAHDGPPKAPGTVGRAEKVQALIFSSNARSADDLYRRCGQRPLQAMVTNRLMPLGWEEQNLLQSSYPAADFSRCLMIQEGRRPAGSLEIGFLVGGGSLFGLTGLGLVGLSLIQRQRERGSDRL